jgi:hypothetical protein
MTAPARTLIDQRIVVEADAEINQEEAKMVEADGS